VDDEPNKLAEEALAGAAVGQVDAEVQQQAPPVDQPEVAAEPDVVEAEQLAVAESDTAEELVDAQESGEPESEPQLTEEQKAEEPVAAKPKRPASKKASGKGKEAPEMNWYILKVQSNRERSISEALRRKIAVEGLDEFFGQVVVPTEKVTEFKGGTKKVVERKLYPGYIVVQMHINDDTWFAVRETSGIGDFTGAGGKPTPMLPHEVSRIIHQEEEETAEAPKLNIRFKIDDRVKIKEGTFEGFEGEVSTIDEHSGRVTVMINIFGRSTPVELEHWQIEAA